MAQRISFTYAPEESRSVAVVKKLIAIVVVVQLTIGLVSAYRAWRQVYSVAIASASGTTLHGGSGLRVDVVASGRVPVDYRLELLQGARAETLATGRTARAGDGFYDPRPRRGSLSVTLTPELLSRFAAGPALLRATAEGRPQWLRKPPPTVRTLAVRIEPQSPPPLPSR